MGDPVERLIVGPSWLGDAVMMGALILRLQAADPAGRITVLTPAHLDDLVRRLPGVDATIMNPFAHGALKLGERARFGRSLRRRFDEAYVLPHSWKSALVPAFAGIRRRIGFVGEGRYLVLSDARPLDEQALPRMVDRFCQLAEPRGAAAPEQSPIPRLAADPSQTAAVPARLGLDAAHVAALATRLAAAGYEPWLIGGPGDAPIGAEVATLAPAARDLTGGTTLGEAIDLLAAARAVVSNDSGLMHVAAALGRPLVALYGSTSPAFTPPLSSDAAILSLGIECSPCFERVCPLGHFKCLNDLTPDAVWAAVAARL
jgi:heptosyltransferase-2